MKPILIAGLSALTMMMCPEFANGQGILKRLKDGVQKGRESRLLRRRKSTKGWKRKEIYEPETYRYRLQCIYNFQNQFEYHSGQTTLHV